jgi:hypothetical protein
VATTSIPRKRARVLVVLLATLVATGILCHGPTSTASAAPALDAGWQQEADRTVALLQRISRIAVLARSTDVELQELRRSTDVVIVQAPRAELRTEQDHAFVRHLAAARPFQAVVDDTDRTRASFWEDAGAVSASATLDHRVRARLTENGRDILHDAVCEAAYGMMTDAEVAEVQETTWRPHVRDLDLEPVAGAIIRYGQKSVSGFFGRGAVQLVSWDRFGRGMAEKISMYGEEMSGTVEDPDPHSMFVLRTRASVYYARTCLRPPR